MQRVELSAVRGVTRLRSGRQRIRNDLDRAAWNVEQNIVSLDASQVAEAQRILKKYELRVTDIASPLFKTDWKGAPRSK